MIDLAVYWVIFGLMMIGLYITIVDGNLIKKVVGLTVFQVSVFMLYIAIANVEGASMPILDASVDSYSSPLPHVLILTAIVVGVATVALALALIVRIRESFGTIEETELNQTEPEQTE